MSETDSKVSEQTSEEVTEKYKQIIKCNGINDEVSEVIMKDAGLKGEGFASETSLVTVNFQNPSVKPINLFVKAFTTNPSHSEFLEETKLFEKEASFLKEYVPSAKLFCERKGHGDLIDIYPKCYYADSKLIVLENLVLEKGYELLDKMEQQDFEAAKLALTTLAKHHAISWAFIKDIGGADEFSKQFPILCYESTGSPLIRNMMEPTIISSINTSIDVLNKSSVKGRDETVLLLEKKKEGLWDFVLDVAKSDPDDPTLVLNHGDYWNNNMMFYRDKASGELVDHKAIDLQAVKYNSPAIDLGYFFFTSVKPEVRRKHLKDMLMHYLDVLNTIGEKLDHPMNLCYDDLFLSFRKKFEFGFWFCGIMLANKATYYASKSLDIASIDIADWGSTMDAAVKKWMEDNPEECEREAIGIVNMINEYKALTLI